MIMYNLAGLLVNVLLLQLNLSRSISADHTTSFWEAGYGKFTNGGVHSILSAQ